MKHESATCFRPVNDSPNDNNGRRHLVVLVRGDVSDRSGNGDTSTPVERMMRKDDLGLNSIALGVIVEVGGTQVFEGSVNQVLKRKGEASGPEGLCRRK